MPGDREPTSEAFVVHTEIDPDSDTSEYAFLEAIAEREGVEMEALPPLYDSVDHFVELLFDQPPSKEAQVELQFSYCGYRVRIDQTGHVTLLPVIESVPS